MYKLTIKYPFSKGGVTAKTHLAAFAVFYGGAGIWSRDKLFNFILKWKTLALQHKR